MSNLTYEQLEVQLTPIQRKAAWLLVNGDLETIGGGKKKSLEEIAKECGIDTRTLYNWRTRDANFISYCTAISDRVTDSFIAEADAMLRKLCLEGGGTVNGERIGSIKALELLYKRKGLLVNKSEVTTNETSQHTTRPLTDAEIQEKLAELNRTLQ